MFRLPPARQHNRLLHHHNQMLPIASLMDRYRFPLLAPTWQHPFNIRQPLEHRVEHQLRSFLMQSLLEPYFQDEPYDSDEPSAMAHFINDTIESLPYRERMAIVSTMSAIGDPIGQMNFFRSGNQGIGLVYHLMSIHLLFKNKMESFKS